MSDDLQPTGDEDLLRQYLAGDLAAFEILLTRHERPLFNFISRSIRDRETAEDIVQEVFVRIVRNASGFQFRSKFTTWMYSIARNLCIDASRRATVRKHVSLDRGPRDDDRAPIERIAGTGPEADDAIAVQAIGADIARAVQALPTDQREVFLMREVQGLPFKEIATVVGVPVNTVKSRMRYALARLQDALREHEQHARELK